MCVPGFPFLSMEMKSESSRNYVRIWNVCFCLHLSFARPMGLFDAAKCTLCAHFAAQRKIFVNFHSFARVPQIHLFFFVFGSVHVIVICHLPSLFERHVLPRIGRDRFNSLFLSLICLESPRRCRVVYCFAYLLHYWILMMCLVSVCSARSALFFLVRRLRRRRKQNGRLKRKREIIEKERME